MIQTFFLNKQLGLLQQIRLYIPRGTLPYVVTAQHGILGSACGVDLSLSDAPYTAKNVHVRKFLIQSLKFIHSLQTETIKRVPNPIFLVYKAGGNTCQSVVTRKSFHTRHECTCV